MNDVRINYKRKHLKICILQRGDAATTKGEIQCPDGWEWTSDWVVDTNRAVDEDGKLYFWRKNCCFHLN